MRSCSDFRWLFLKEVSYSEWVDCSVSGGTADATGKLPVRETLAAESGVALDQDRRREIAAKVQYL